MAIVALFKIRQDPLDVSGQTTGSSTSRLPRQRSHCPVIVANGDSVCAIARRHVAATVVRLATSVARSSRRISDEEVQVVAAVDALVLAAVLGHERGAVRRKLCSDNRVQRCCSLRGSI